MSTWREIVENVTDSAHRGMGLKEISAQLEHDNVMTISQLTGPRLVRMTLEKVQLTVTQHIGATTERMENYTIDGDQIVSNKSTRWTAQ